MFLSKKLITKALIRLHGCAGWSAPVLFANPRRQVFSRRGPYIYASGYNIGPYVYGYAWLGITILSEIRLESNLIHFLPQDKFWFILFFEFRYSQDQQCKYVKQL